MTQQCAVCNSLGFEVCSICRNKMTSWLILPDNHRTFLCMNPHCEDFLQNRRAGHGGKQAVVCKDCTAKVALGESAVGLANSGCS